MIRFAPESIPKLNAVLNSLYISNPQEHLSTIGMVLIKQISPTITEFTTYDPSFGVYSKRVAQTVAGGWGNEGEEYLVEYKSFKEAVALLSRNNSTSLTIKLKKGTVVLYSNLVRLADKNKDTFSGSKSIVSYPGDSDEFAPVVLLDILSDIEPNAQFTQTDFFNLIKPLDKFSRFTATEKQRGIVLQLIPDSLRAFSRSSIVNCYSATKINCTCNGSDEFVFIDSFYLSKLLSLGEVSTSLISLYVTNEWLLFTSDNGFIQCARVQEDNEAWIDEMLVEEFKLCNSLTIPENYREFNLISLHQAFFEQKPSSLDTSTDLLCLEDSDEGQWVITVASSRTIEGDNDQSRVMFNLEHFKDDWPLMGFSYDAIILLLSNLQKNWSCESSWDVKVEWHIYQIGSEPRWVVKFYPVYQNIEEPILISYYGDSYINPELF